MADTITPWCSVDGRRALGSLCARHLSEQQRAALTAATSRQAPTDRRRKR